VLPDGQWQNTPWGRIVVGIFVAQGLAYGLQLLCTAGLLAASEEPTRTVWATIFGLVLLQALQAFSLLVGGALTAASQQRGMFLGGMVGLVSGPLFVVIQLWNGEVLSEVALYGQPILALLFGTLGGLLGSTIWKPLPTLSMPKSKSDKSKSRPVSRTSPSAMSGPIAWGRVAVGIGLAAAAVLFPQLILTWIMDASQGRLRARSELQAQLITWEIGGLITLLAGAIAGATTSNGFKQGLCVGVGVAVVLIGYHFGGQAVALERLVFMVASVLCLTLVGGWFGGQLFPPVQGRRSKIPTIL
jgi:hypothetical protein